MRALAAGQATWHRIKRPATWGAVLLFGPVWAHAPGDAEVEVSRGAAPGLKQRLGLA